MTPAKFPDTDWFQEHVVTELERLNDWMGELNKKQESLVVEVAKLKVKSGIWGFAAGSISVLILVVIEIVRNTV